MDSNMQNIDDLFRQELGGYTEAPPPPVWAALEKRLDDKKRRRVFPLRWLWYFSIISFVVLLGAALAWRSAVKDGAPAIAAANNTNELKQQDAVPAAPAVAINTPKQTTIKHKHTKHTTYKKQTTAINSEATTTNHNNSTEEKNKQDNYNAPAGDSYTATAGNEPPSHESAAIAEPQPAPAPHYEYVVNRTRKHNLIAADMAPVLTNPNPVAVTVSTDVEQTRVLASTTAIGSDAAAVTSVPKPATTKATVAKTTATVAETTASHNTVTVKATPAGDMPAKETTVAVTTPKQKHDKKADGGKPAIDAGTNNTIAYSDTKESSPAYKSASTTKTGNKTQHTAPKEHSTKATPIPVATTDASNKSSKTAASVKTPKYEKRSTTNVLATSLPTSEEKPAATETPTVRATKAPRKKDSKQQSKQVHDHADGKGIAATTSNEATSLPKATELTKKASQHIVANTSASPVVAKTVAGKSMVTKTIEQPGKASTIAAATTAVNKVAKHTSNRKPSVGTKHKKVELNGSAAATAATTTRNKETIVASAPTTASDKTVAQITGKTPKQKTQTKAITTAATYAAANTKAKSSVAINHKKTKVPTQHNATAKSKTASTNMLAAAKHAVKRSLPKAATAPKNNALASAKSIAEHDGAIDQQPAIAPVPQAAVTAKKEAPKSKDSVATAPPLAVADSAIAPADTSSKTAKTSRFSYGIKGGYEGGLGAGGGNKFVVAPYLHYQLTPKLSLMIQPSVKMAQLSKRVIGNAGQYFDSGSSSYQLIDSSLVHLVSGQDLWQRNYKETHDSFAKTYTVGGTYWEVELPVMMRYQITPKLSVYGGLNMAYGRLMQVKENTDHYLSTNSVQTFGGLNAPAPNPANNNGLVYAGSSLTTYSGPLYPTQEGSALRLGYMLGFSYEFKKRWMLDALVQQTKAKTYTQGGYNANTALSLPYFRLMLGYRLSK